MSEFLTQFMERRGELLELTIEHMEMTSLGSAGLPDCRRSDRYRHYQE